MTPTREWKTKDGRPFWSHMAARVFRGGEYVGQVRTLPNGWRELVMPARNAVDTRTPYFSMAELEAGLDPSLKLEYFPVTDDYGFSAAYESVRACGPYQYPGCRVIS